MHRKIIAGALSAAAFIAVPTLAVGDTSTTPTTPTTTVAAPPPKPKPLRNGCMYIYSRHDFIKYAKRVFHSNRKPRKHRAAKLTLLVRCQKNANAQHWAKHTRRVMRKNQNRRIYLHTCSNSVVLPCIAVASRRWHVSYQWLVNCARSEGGIGPSDYNKMNYSGSGAGGNFQFMPKTFYYYVRRSGWHGQAIWLNAQQQALTAAYMFHIGESSQWTGAGC